MTDVAANHRAVMERIGAAATNAGRDPGDILLVAVTKTFPADVIARAADAGVRDVGENRAQELKEKATVLGDLVRWHFIGHLQTNKVRSVIGHVHLLHSIDRYGLGEAVGRRARSIGLVQDVLIEVNVAGEASKHGVEPAKAVALAEEVDGLDGVKVRGFMAIPPATTVPEESRAHFRDLAALRDRLVTSLPDATHLSMGMSGDYEVAVEEGATIVRVGRAIFGPRHGGAA